MKSFEITIKYKIEQRVRAVGKSKEDVKLKQVILVTEWKEKVNGKRRYHKEGSSIMLGDSEQRIS